jgi:putative ABC transport system permease protein
MMGRIPFFIRLFVWFSLRDMRRHPGRALIVIIGIAMGAAVFASVRLSIDATMDSFTKSINLIAGQADLVITRPGGVVPESIIAQLLRNPAILNASPVSTTYVLPKTERSEAFLLIGIDPILDRPFRSWQVDQANDMQNQAWLSLLSRPYTLILGEPLARTLGVGQGESFDLMHAWQEHRFEIAGILKSEGLALVEGGRVAVTDIATFQEFTGSHGHIERVDLLLARPLTAGTRQALQQALPDGIDLSLSTAMRESGKGMIKAYQLNLSILSFASLFVGMFLVYSLVALNAASRRKELAILRALGASSNHIFFVFIAEGAFLGLLGSLAALPLGNLMVIYMLEGVSQTISTLFIRVRVDSLALDTWEILFSLGTTLFVTVMAAFQPAWEARQVSPKEALESSQTGRRASHSTAKTAIMGSICILVAWPLAQAPPLAGIPFWGYLAILLLFVGFSLSAPSLFRLVGSRLAPVALKRIGIPAYLAARYVRDSGIRTAVSVGALITAVALFTALVIMIHSFRHTVIYWTDQTIQGDLFVSARMASIHQFKYPIPDNALQTIQAYASDVDIIPNKSYFLTYNNLPYEFEMLDLAGFERSGSFLWLEGDTTENRLKLRQGQGVVVSEVFANRNGLGIGDTYKAQIEQSLVTLPIVGIVRDYRTQGGVVFYSLNHFNKNYHEISWSGLRIYFKNRHQDINQAAAALKAQLLQRVGGQIDVIDGNQLRGSIFRIFDETFAITSVLLLVALFIAAMGIVTTLSVLILERARQLNTLFAIGGSHHQLRAMVVWEALYMVVIGELAGLACGFILSFILIFVINQQSFGWTFIYRVDWGALSTSLPLIILTALGASLPALRLIFKQSPAVVLRT